MSTLKPGVFHRLLIVPAILACFSLFATAQNPSTADSSPSGSVVGKNTVIAITVTDSRAELLSGLKAENFSLTSGGKPQTITSVQWNDEAACIGLMLDRSGSMRHKTFQAVAALMDFVNASNPADQFFVVNFNDSPYLDQDFTTDHGKVEHALTRQEARGGTALYDAIWASADHLHETGTCKRRVLLVLTDGGDNDSRKSQPQLVGELTKIGDLSLYIVNISDYDSNVHMSKRAIESLVGPVQGEAVFASLGKLENILRGLAAELRNQYIITYTPTAERNGNPGQIEVKVHAGGHSDVHAKVQKTKTVAAAANQ